MGGGGGGGGVVFRINGERYGAGGEGHSGGGL